ncbi:hypothetical protein ACFQV8_37610 [Pseudonocardia benzenivorans]
MSARPRAARSVTVITQSSSSSGVPSRSTTTPTSGSSSRCARSFATWVSSSANTTRLPESARMNATSGAPVVG